MKNGKSFFEKIKEFIKNIFNKKQNKMLVEKNEVHLAEAEDNTNYIDEKTRIFNLYNDIKLGKVDVFSLSKSDLQKLTAISNEEVNLLEKEYSKKIENLQKVI